MKTPTTTTIKAYPASAHLLKVLFPDYRNDAVRLAKLLAEYLELIGADLAQAEKPQKEGEE